MLLNLPQGNRLEKLVPLKAGTFGFRVHEAHADSQGQHPHPSPLPSCVSSCLFLTSLAGFSFFLFYLLFFCERDSNAMASLLPPLSTPLSLPAVAKSSFFFLFLTQPLFIKSPPVLCVLSAAIVMEQKKKENVPDTGIKPLLRLIYFSLHAGKLAAFASGPGW